MPSTPKNLKPNAAGCAERKTFRAANFFSSLLETWVPWMRRLQPKIPLVSCLLLLWGGPSVIIRSFLDGKTSQGG